VQVSNKDAIAFYEKFGFHIVERKENYYKRIEPADAFVVQKNLKEQKSAETSSSKTIPTTVATRYDEDATDNSSMNTVD
jgi:N-alpha-acetyltransferase 50